MIIARKNNTNYFDLLDSIDAKPVLMKHQKCVNPDKDKYLVIRHDVDDKINHALMFAEREFVAGISSTYFFHPNRRYFDYSPIFADKLRQFEKLGHEIGYHCDALARWHEGKGNLVDIIGKPVIFLNEAMEVSTISGSAAHGSKYCVDKHTPNYEVWKDCPYPVAKGGPYRFRLGDFSLEYEAYFLRRDAYLSDNHGGWSGGIKSEIAPFEVPGVQDQSIMESIIKRFNDMDSGVMQLTIHPQHWKIS